MYLTDHLYIYSCEMFIHILLDYLVLFFFINEL